MKMTNLDTNTDKSYFVKKDKTVLILPKKFSEMLELLIDNIFVMFGGRVYA
jgi:hypothetical protein